MPSSENAQATLKSGTPAEEGTLASSVETAVGEETEVQAVTKEPDYEGPGRGDTGRRQVPEVLETPADEAVAKLTANAEEPDADQELGKASLESRRRPRGRDRRRK